MRRLPCVRPAGSCLIFGTTSIAPSFIRAAQAKRRRLTWLELLVVRTTSELIERGEENYGLPREQATREVEYWALDKQL